MSPSACPAGALEIVDNRLIDDLSDLFSLVWVASLRATDVPLPMQALREAGHADPAVFGPGRVHVPTGALREPLAMVLDIRPATPVNQHSLGANTAIMAEP